MTFKLAGDNCPRCGGKPAEYTMRGAAAQWKCHCGATGQIGVQESAAQDKPRTVHPHWSARKRG